MSWEQLPQWVFLIAGIAAGPFAAYVPHGLRGRPRFAAISLLVSLPFLIYFGMDIYDAVTNPKQLGHGYWIVFPILFAIWIGLGFVLALIIWAFKLVYRGMRKRAA